MNNTYTLELTESEVKTLELALRVASKEYKNYDFYTLMHKIGKISDFIKRNKSRKEK